MTQIRKTATKKNIKVAFTHLLKEKGFDNLTVTDISREARINRGTFYTHYVDKYDLMEKLEEETIFNLKQLILLENKDNFDDPIEIIPYNAILSALNYVKSDFKFIEALSEKGKNYHFTQMMKDVISDLIESEIVQSNKLNYKMDNLPVDYAREILLSSIVSIILLWIKKGAIETPEYIAQMITKAKQISPYELLI